MQTEQDVVTIPKMKVLCVDDEVNILKSMQRILRKYDFDLLLASSGQDALALFEKHQIDLVVSDMKMPGMSGAELLANVAEHSPDTYRIILTGYSDMESTVAAVNKGKIHRYIQKPWENAELVEAIQEGLDQVKLKNENKRLQSVIAKQNKILRGLNQNLEEKVTLRTKQIKAAHLQLERDNQAMERVLINFISINPNLSGGFAQSVSKLAKKIAVKMKCSDRDTKNVSLAGLLCEIGLLGIEPKLFLTPFNELNYNEQSEYFTQTHVALSILGPASRLESVTDIIFTQFEQYSGKGHPNNMVGEEIPLGARILAVARDFWRYATLKIQPGQMTHAEIRAEMNKYRGSVYDPEILDVFITNPDLISDELIEKPLKTSEIKPGMVLKQNIFNEQHLLVLAEGHEFTESTINKLIQFEKSQEKVLSLSIETNQ